MQAVCGKNLVPQDEDTYGSSPPIRHYGAILADDMGLGKTLQILATSLALMNARDETGQPLVRKVLVVAPSSVIKNWGKEIKKWLGYFYSECHRVLLPGKDAAKNV
jgi:SNF2 family DNA or RNA helicase